MANNQYVNKVQFGNDTLIDLTNDTVTANKIVSGYTAHSKSGAPITGTITKRSTSDLTYAAVPYSEVNRYYFKMTVPKGYYEDNGGIGVSSIWLPVPETSYAVFSIYIPNGVTNPSQNNSEDWIRLDIEVDSEANSNISDDTIPAIGVSF